MLSAIFCIVGVIFLAFMPLGYIIYAMGRDENRVLNHLPKAKRKEARPLLRGIGLVFWGDHRNLGNELASRKADFIETYGDDPAFTDALDHYIGEAWYGRERARGGPFYRGAHRIG